MDNISDIAKYGFELKNSDKFALFKCPACNMENYALNVISGICTWCGYNINVDNLSKFTFLMSDYLNNQT